MDCIGSPDLVAAAAASAARRGALARDVVTAGLPGHPSPDVALASLARNALFEQAVLAAIRARLAEAKAAAKP